jgi:hypothetical protein
MQLESPERGVPDALQLLTDGAERVPSGAVEAEPAVRPDRDQPGIGQRFQLERHGAEGDVRHRRMDVAGTPLLVPDQPQDFLPARRGESGQDREYRGHGITLVKTK